MQQCGILTPSLLLALSFAAAPFATAAMATSAAPPEDIILTYGDTEVSPLGSSTRHIDAACRQAALANCLL